MYLIPHFNVEYIEDHIYKHTLKWKMQKSRVGLYKASKYDLYNYNLSTECKNDFKAELHTVLQINKEIKSEGNETTKFGFIN